MTASNTYRRYCQHCEAAMFLPASKLLIRRFSYAAWLVGRSGLRALVDGS